MAGAAACASITWHEQMTGGGAARDRAAAPLHETQGYADYRGEEERGEGRGERRK